MNRPRKSLADASHLLQTVDLIAAATKTIINEWALESDPGKPAPSQSSTSAVPASSSISLPSDTLYTAQRTVLAAVGKLTELVSEPNMRLLEVSSCYWEARCLHVAAERQIPDFIERETKKANRAVEIKDIADATKIEVGKLTRILRCLCSIGIFAEPEGECFANNSISGALVGDNELRAYILLFALDPYSASDHLPRYLLDPAVGHSYDVQKTSWQQAMGTEKPRWDWLEEHVKAEDLGSRISGYPGYPDEKSRLAHTVDGALYRPRQKHEDGEASSDTLYRRPELEVFGLAMVGGGRTFGEAHVYDYPWQDLGKATIVDVGGGVGGFDIQLSKIYPNLRFVVQDRGPVLEQARKQVWPREAAECLDHGRVEFVDHDFFEPNPSRGAEIYWLRYIIHDWSDNYCISILRAVRSAMGPHSRVLICDQIMNTTRGDASIPDQAPAPLPANYGYYTRYSHQRDLAMMGIINGIERTPAQFKELLKSAGLKLRKIWNCRSQVGLIEAVLSDTSL